MPLLLALTIILPLLGAGGILGLSLVRRIRPYIRYVTLAVVCVTTGLVFALIRMQPVVVIPSLWQPSLLFGSTLTLQVDGTMYPLVLALALVTCSAVLVEFSRMETPQPQLEAALLALLPASFLALWSANVLTLAVAWGLLDLIQTVAYVAAGGSVRTAMRGLVLGNLATLLLWGGMLLSGGKADSELWSLIALDPDGAPLALWAVAGMLRLWTYPSHLSAPDDLVTAPSLATPLLLGPMVGWGLWLRLVEINGGFIPGYTWVTSLGAGALALGGLLAWSCESPRRLLPWVGMGANGAVLLVAGLAQGSAPVVIVAGSVAWSLAIAVFFLGDGWQPSSIWWNIPALVGLLALLGSPLTLGFVTAATFLGELVQKDLMEWGIVFWGSIFGNLFLVPSLIRRLLAAPASPLPERRGLTVVRGVGLGLPMLVLLGAGIYPPLLLGSEGSGVSSLSLGSLLAMPRLVGWLLWGVSLTCGALLAWQEGILRSKLGPLLSVVHDALRMEWFNDVMTGALDRGLTVLRSADEVVGGAGALLWSLLLFLLILLVWGGL